MRRFFFVAFSVALLLAPSVAGAALFNLPLVPCGRSDQVPAVPCSPCHLFEAFHNIVSFILYGVTGPVATFMIVVAGGMMLLSAGSVTRYSLGLKILKNTLIGVAIILLSWVFVNFLIKSLAKGSQYDNWYEFSCPAGLSSITNIETTFPAGNPPPAPNTQAIAQQVNTTFCQPAHLAALSGVPNNTTLNAPSLTNLMACIARDPIVRSLYDPTKVFTYEQNNPLCNLDRGNPACGSGGCQHAVNSCHYGGKTGTQGAMAVDYNANATRITYVIATRTIVSSDSDSRCSPPGKTTGGLCRTVFGEAGLFDELYRVMTKNSCQYEFLNFEQTNRQVHTHISTLDCSSDGEGVDGRARPVYP